MFKVRVSNLALAVVFCALLGFLLIFKDGLAAAHIDGMIDYVSADAMNYYELYETLFSDVPIGEAPALILVGSPIVLMKLADGNLFPIQLLQLILMMWTLKVGADSFDTMRGRAAFITGTLLFPYFLVGFMALNKEIYAMCGAIFFASYMVRGNWRHLLIALTLAMCARYYMLLALLAMVFLIPRSGPPRYRLILALLVVISLAAPFVKMLVPGYSSEGLIEGPGGSSAVFARIIDSFGYALIYPVKYLALIPTRAYSLLIEPERLANWIEAMVSLISMAAVAVGASVLLLRKPASPLVKRLIVLGMVAPIPIMWTEIMHWRYFSFVYFFFLFAIVLHFVDEPRKRLLAERAGGHA
jgi:hypothetical protein